MFYRFFLCLQSGGTNFLDPENGPNSFLQIVQLRKRKSGKEGPNTFANLENKRLSYFNASRGADDKFLEIAILACAPLEKQTRFLLRKNLVDAKSCLAYIGED